uniref:M1 n=1 Tax=Wuhan spiny eel influenza virus TaxID=2116483 RepID=A0A2P1GNM2_9ORTO|nr:M1 [Wuhan spiny eel influenza virus]
MSIYRQTITYLLASLDDCEGKDEISTKLLDWLGGKNFDADSALEWIKNKNCLGDIQKSMLGLAICFTRPKDMEKLRRFILEPLTSTGTTATKRKGLELAERKLAKCTDYHSAFEIAEGFDNASSLYALASLYQNGRKYTAAVKLGLLSAVAEKMAHQTQKASMRTARSRVGAVRKEHAMVEAHTAARHMESSSNADLADLGESVQQSLAILRGLGGIAKGDGIHKDVIQMMKGSDMGNNSLVRKYL